MIAERIWGYVEEKGIERRDLAGHVGMSESVLFETLKGKRTLFAEDYVAICDYLSVPYSTFIDYEGRSA